MESIMNYESKLMKLLILQIRGVSAPIDFSSKKAF
jgi:hypothetical protein